MVPELDTVADEAVNLRNVYVHSSKSRINSELLWQLFPYLTDTLEFIFFASDFVEAGWNISDWCRKDKLMGHPFHGYLVKYNDNLRELKAAMG